MKWPGHKPENIWEEGMTGGSFTCNTTPPFPKLIFKIFICLFETMAEKETDLSHRFASNKQGWVRLNTGTRNSIWQRRGWLSHHPLPPRCALARSWTGNGGGIQRQAPQYQCARLPQQPSTSHIPTFTPAHFFSFYSSMNVYKYSHLNMLS